MVELIEKFAKQKKATLAQIVLAMAAGPEAMDRAIPGTTRLHRLEENIGAAAVELTPVDIRQLDGRQL